MSSGRRSVSSHGMAACSRSNRCGPAIAPGSLLSSPFRRPGCELTTMKYTATLATISRTVITGGRRVGLRSFSGITPDDSTWPLCKLLQASARAGRVSPMADSNVLKRYLDAGMAFTQLTQARAEALVKDLVKTGEVQTEQAQTAVDELLERSRKNTERLFEQVRNEVRDQVANLGLATKADIARLERRIDGLRSRPRPSRRPRRHRPEDATKKPPRQKTTQGGVRQEGPPPKRTASKDRLTALRRRLDAELVRRGLAAEPRPGPGGDRGRPGAGRRRAGREGRPPGRRRRADPSCSGPPPRFVSRGGEKLDAALDRFGVDVAGRRVLDAGASTGGFTDCLLQRGAAARRRRRRRPRPAARAAARRPAGRRPRAHQRPDRRLGDARRRRSTSSWPTCRSSRCAPCAARCVGAAPRRAADWCCWSSRSSRPGGPRRPRAGRDRRPGGVAPGARRGRVPRSAAQGAAIMGPMVSPLRGADGNVEFLVHAAPAGASGAGVEPPPLDGAVVEPLRRRRGPALMAAVALVVHHAAGRGGRAGRRGGRRGSANAGHEVRLPADDADAVGLPDHGVRRRRASPTGSTWPSASAATARCCAPSTWWPAHDVPVLGVNVGQLGYLTEVEPRRAAATRSSGSSPATYAHRRADDARGRPSTRRRRPPRHRRRWRSTRPCSRRRRSGHTVRLAGQHRRRAVHDLRRRRPHRGHARPARPRTPSRPAGRSCRRSHRAPAAHAGVAAHAVRPLARARPRRAESASRSAATARPTLVGRRAAVGDARRGRRHRLHAPAARPGAPRVVRPAATSTRS